MTASDDRVPIPPDKARSRGDELLSEALKRLDELFRNRRDDPLALAAAARALLGEVQWFEHMSVREARRAGRSWQAIAEALGTSRQAVYEQYHKHDKGWHDEFSTAELIMSVEAGTLKPWVVAPEAPDYDPKRPGDWPPER